MYRVMLADDERWVRLGLIQSIPWDGLGLVLAGEAADGQDAYELLLAERPDLLFLDMRMPGLDGKELLALLHAELPELLTIVVSGYSDFEYTQQAIRHHAFDYLLKPVKKEELAAVLEKAVAELARRSDERQRSAAARQDAGWFRDLLLAPTASGDASSEAKLPPAWLDRQAVVFAGRPDTYREQAESPDRLSRLREALERQRSFHLGGRWECALSPAPDGRAELIGAIAADGLPPAELQRL
ncbi:putative DNA-binding response regulator, partial [Paenibacillus sp. 598K]|uniref:response regulator n=1 Tax=Paenibacillus sp. 598K TaxID=1117987 RepID=UPI000FF91EAA